MKILSNNMYLLLIDEESRGIAFGEIGVNMRHSKLEVETRNMGGYGSDKYYWSHKKCLAYYPLNSEAKELDLPLLPPFEVDIEIMWSDFNKNHNRNCPLGKEQFVRAINYKAIQQLDKQFSLEDMEAAFEAGEAACIHRVVQERTDYMTFDKFIQSLSTQQLPKEFIPEYEREHDDTVPFPKMRDSKEIKTITNSGGKEEIVGTYKYNTKKS